MAEPRVINYAGGQKIYNKEAVDAMKGGAVIVDNLPDWESAFNGTIYYVRSQMKGYIKGDSAGQWYPLCSCGGQSVAAPVFSPNGGSIASGSQVTITCATEDAIIYFTTDGSDPTTNSSVYIGPITLTADTTVKALATKAGMTDSAITSASYTIQMDQVATPTFNPAAGSVTIGTTVAINCTTAGATIHYTVDGSNPTTSSPVYSAPVSIDAATTIKAIAVKEGMVNSNVGSAAYTIKKVATPTFSPTPGAVPSGTEVTISCATTGAEIHYTTDGTEPSAASPVYTAPIELTAATVIKAIAFKSDMLDSSVATAEYIIAVTMYRYAGWIVGEDPIGSINITKEVLEAMDGLETDTLPGATSPDLGYVVTHDVDWNSGRTVWAYPAEYGLCPTYRNTLGEFPIDSSFEYKSATIDGIAYHCYVLRDPIAGEEGTTYSLKFIGQ